VDDPRKRQEGIAQEPWLPRGVFLDTVIVAYLAEYGGAIFESEPIDPALPDQQRRQIEALQVLMRLTERAGLAFAVSSEVIRQREGRGHYVLDIADHWAIARHEQGIKERGLAPMTLVATLPSKDQLLLAEAYRSGCEVVLTNDLKWTRQKHSHTLSAMGMTAYTPAALVERIRPWLGLFL
jgi:hypothetical protein